MSAGGDITERKEAEGKLAQREEVFRHASDAVEGVIFEWDITRGIVHRSRGVQEILGIDEFEFAIVDGQQPHLPSTFPGMKELMPRVHPKDRAATSRAIEHAFQHKSEVHTEFRLKANDGCFRSYATIARPLFDAAGAPHGLVGVTQEVTARRASEARLRRSEQLLRTTTANTADTLILVDADLRIRFINKGCGGMTIEQIVGCEISAVLPEPARCAVVAKLRQVLQTDASHLYRIAQEALTNAARHGHASKVEILLLVATRSFLLRITDDGAGIESADPPVTGMGLKIMRYRASMIGARFEIGSNAPRGTVVRVIGEQPPVGSELHSVHAIYGGNDYGRELTHGCVMRSLKPAWPAWPAASGGCGGC